MSQNIWPSHFSIHLSLLPTHIYRYISLSLSLSLSLSVDRICSAVYRGVSRDGRFVGGGARNQEPDGDTRRRDSDLDMFGPSDRHNTLRPMSLVYCIDLYVDPI